MKTVEREFGKLVKAYVNQAGYLVIQNDLGRELKMSPKFPRLNFVHQNAGRMINQEVTITTSQTTAQWSTLAWFSDIKLTNPNY